MNGGRCGLCDINGIEDWKAHAESEGHKRRRGGGRISLRRMVRSSFTIGIGRRSEVQEAYRRWWLGKRCRVYTDREFKRVTDVIWYGPPSGVYGFVKLVYDDGTVEIVSPGRDVFRPRKSDVEVDAEVETVQ